MKINKLKLLCLFVFLSKATGGTLFAQDCNVIVLPLVNNDVQRLNQYPSDKLAYRCAFSQCSFEVADELDENAPLHEISEVVDVFTGEHLSDDMDIDLNVLSYYRYDFSRFQVMHADEPVYFRTAGSAHPYLVLVPKMLADQRAMEKINNLSD